ncbi:MAG TPA: acyltransferase, partial [Candidatus Paceibacterota bacterium]|nr:acyltransferase [Candidatus Paceibacterota bacterium]
EKGFTIAVGENARIANEVSIQTSHYHAVHRGAPVKTGDVRIGRNVWIGMRSVVSPGVSIGDGAIVGAMSFVSKDIPAFEMWGGVPARKIRDLPRDPDWKRA